MRQGKAVYHYNLAGIQRDEVVSTDKLIPGRHTVVLDFAYDGGGLGKGGLGRLAVDGVPAGQGRVRQTLYSRISLDETLDIGQDTGTPISEDYQVPFGFNGKLKKVTIEPKPLDPSTVAAAQQAANAAAVKKALQD